MQVQRRWPGQTEEMFHDVFQTVQLPVNDFQAAGGLFPHVWRRLGQVFLQQLNVDIEGTERIPNLVRETRQ